MNWAWVYWMRNTGTYRSHVVLPLHENRQYLLTGYLTLTDGDDYAHVYIFYVCHRRERDHRLCGLRGLDKDWHLPIVEVIGPGADMVCIELHTKGGIHRAEGVLWDIT